MSWLGIDIGGANIKIADGEGYASSVAFPLWQRPDELASELRALLSQAPNAESLAITMTGELADCFATKAEGVAHILDAVEQAADGRRVFVYLTNGELVSPDQARAQPLLAAASNWHALATFAARYLQGESGLLIDVGSTTSDIIPLNQSGPQTSGTTDPERLLMGELVYTGVERSPLCAIVRHVRWRDELCPVAQEVFATAADVYLLTGDLPEDPHNVDTADGRPRTKEFALARLARTICADATMFSEEDAGQVIDVVHRTQISMLLDAAQQVVERMPLLPKTILLSGHGNFLSIEVAELLYLPSEVLSLTDQLGPNISRAACAHALAVLARERGST